MIDINMFNRFFDPHQRSLSSSYIQQSFSALRYNMLLYQARLYNRASPEIKTSCQSVLCLILGYFIFSS